MSVDGGEIPKRETARHVVGATASVRLWFEEGSLAGARFALLTRRCGSTLRNEAKPQLVRA